MKRHFAGVVSVFLALALAVLPASAQVFTPEASEHVAFTVRRADADIVMNDGVIYPAEYDRLNISNYAATTPLTLEFYGGDRSFDRAESLLESVEYLFSWDEIHGLNFAVRFRPDEFSQSIPEGGGDTPGYAFLSNLGILLKVADSADSSDPILSYAVSRNAETGEYMRGHDGHLGLSGSFSPEPNRDFIIAFSDNGYITCEWSVPFREISPFPMSVGSRIYLTLGVYAGTETSDRPLTDCYGVSLGRFGLMSGADGAGKNAAVTLAETQIDNRSNPFTDVPDSAWYSAGVEFVYMAGLMNGVSKDRFSPDGTTTRAEVATVLYRLAGAPPSAGACPFTDLGAEWYRDAVKWARGAGVVNGVSANRFDPDGKITREQLVTMLYRYAKTVLGLSCSSGTDISGTEDYDSVSLYARDAFAWACDRSIIDGLPSSDSSASCGRLAPSDRATRAQFATVLRRFARALRQ